MDFNPKKYMLLDAVSSAKNRTKARRWLNGLTQKQLRTIMRVQGIKSHNTTARFGGFTKAMTAKNRTAHVLFSATIRARGRLDFHAAGASSPTAAYSKSRSNSKAWTKEMKRLTKLETKLARLSSAYKKASKPPRSPRKSGAKTVKSLRAEAGKIGIKGRSKMNKAALEKAINATKKTSAKKPVAVAKKAAKSSLFKRAVSLIGRYGSRRKIITAGVLAATSAAAYLYASTKKPAAKTKPTSKRRRPAKKRTASGRVKPHYRKTSSGKRVRVRGHKIRKRRR